MTKTAACRIEDHDERKLINGRMVKEERRMLFSVWNSFKAQFPAERAEVQD